MAVEKKDAASIGRKIYENRILPQVKPEDKGKVVVIDVNSGDYEVGYDDAAAMFSLLKRRPGRLHVVGARWVSSGAPHGFRVQPPAAGIQR